MLTRQLASAGSGKTYTLARQFIWLFITIPTGEQEDIRGEQPRRLRTRPELVDSLRHILAITFTNKATGEMKQRIISKLAALAGFSTGMTTKDIDYLDDFSVSLGVTPEEIARVSAQALDILLNDFSDFQVSTIDSFFQQVMRTFTYEAELPDNFQLELDSAYVAGLGLDSALSDLNANRSSENFRYWTKLLVETEVNRTGSWNLFSPGRKTLYNKVLLMLKTMESESFKENLRSLKDYFDGMEGAGDQSRGGRLADIYALYDSLYLLPLKADASEVRAEARNALNIIATRGVEVSNMARYLHGRIVKLASLNWKTGADGKFNGENFMVDTVMKKGIASDPDLVNAVRKIGTAYDSFLRRFSDPAVRSWMLYSKAIRQLAVTWEIKKKADELMLDSNSIRLSDTNSILKTIIGDDETPFIYERIGSRLDHFLIDEFQDTSRLQWENTLPLLHESEARGCENLIIGDPKQSIYRFRNADSTLITSAVPKEFPDLHDAGKDPKKNTNWRSALNIVRFNNFLFHSLATLGMDYSESYGDVIQYSSKSTDSPEGYVRMRFFRQSPETDAVIQDSDDKNDGTSYPAYFSEIAQIINDLRRRGYRQKDIAVLVGTHRVGGQVIDSLLDFNSQIDPGDPEAPSPIRFVSEDSLKVTNAGGVRIVLDALTAINGSMPFTRIPVMTGAESHTDGPEKDPMEEYGIFASADRPKVSDDLRGMLAGMSVVTLPAIIEQVISTFIPESIRKAEAPFLAAFQDTAIEFCESHQPDIASFLKWWNKHGDALTISSPESTDAVQVVTVHSSKGLEFGAVIIPDANYRFESSPLKSETVWLRPELPEQPDAPLPPCLPIELGKEVEGTFHERVLIENKKEVATDKLNAAYVAFTRAKYELHALCEIPRTFWPTDNPSKKNHESEGQVKIPAVGSLSSGFFRIMRNPTFSLPFIPEDKIPFVADPEEFKSFRGQTILSGTDVVRETIEYTYGVPVDLRDKENREEAVNMPATIGSYTVNDLLPVLHYRSEGGIIDIDESAGPGDETDVSGESFGDITGRKEADTDAEDENTVEDEIIPGSLGSLIREAVGKIASGMSVERAMLSLKVTGRWTETQTESAGAALTRMYESEQGRKWFRPGPEWEIFANRPLIQRGRRTRTPDLLLISHKANKAVIVNIKATPTPDVSEWGQTKCQMRALRRTGFTGEVEAWICHPISDTMIRVETDD